jgi:hypothetical protein
MSDAPISSEELARRIARAIFACGDNRNDKVQRIELKGGTWPDHETDLGGLCEDALASLIRKHL